MTPTPHSAAAADMPEAPAIVKLLRDLQTRIGPRKPSAEAPEDRQQWTDIDNACAALTASAPAASSAAPAVVAWELVHSVLGPELTAHKSRADEAERLGILVHPLCRASAFAYAAPTAPQAGAESYPPLGRPLRLASMVPTLRAMATNYSSKHAWDKLDADACARAAAEIDELRAHIDAAAALRARGAVPSEAVVGWQWVKDPGAPGLSYADACKQWKPHQRHGWQWTNRNENRWWYLNGSPEDGDEDWTYRRNPAGNEQPTPAAPSAQADTPVPSGWKLVPVEPTKAMLRAGSDDLRLGNCTGTLTRAGECYRAMLAAAPAAPMSAQPSDADGFGSAEHWKEKAQYWAGVAHDLRQQALRGEPVDGIVHPPAALPGEQDASPTIPELSKDEILEIAEPFGAFQYGDAQGDKRIDFARAVLRAAMAAKGQEGGAQ